MDRRKIFAFFVLIVVCGGCRQGPPAAFPDWVGNFNSTLPAEGRGTAFSEYGRAADYAEKDGGKFLDMVSFYSFQRTKATAQTESAQSILRNAAVGECNFEFVPSDPFNAPPHQRGWRLLGRVIVWKIKDAIEKKDFGEAVAETNLATKFGFDISGGGATDASLGLAVANEARQAIAPALDQLDQNQLSSLAAGISRALDAKPSIKEAIEHEHENMLEGVQAVQDAYRAQNFDSLSRNLGPDSRSAIEFLPSLYRKDSLKRPSYFEGFAAEADAEADYMKSVADLPVAARMGVPVPKLNPERPWRKFSKELFSSLRPLVDMNDETVARTRLLILESSILAEIKANGVAPKDLSQFSEELRTDPYSGKQFIYGADGDDYHVYSVGSNLRDDGGETDETYSQPDLRLERDE